ncbi:otu domain protein 5 [Ichthyophthirius multifiliis]|uniref:Otu domain protein 5 n=1 Tax=Ichthyophthirius multifiliis TaxID=5932 RepID=G0QNC3_ICHMU|nr:otu domain protein 5 [Ichthyophthirius multifiliis]EGR33288.1 otu domain protein 5 [Ichthyophthirius multifiliis]|eukprot:XP_004037274.1 otu domain protein 5 [Ichthyophthirius multifiliis]
MKIITVQGDGNCLFRAVSDQIYGSENYHKEIRYYCIEYIKIERQFFENYIDIDFDEYIFQKKQDGVWGDDIELQALSEIYNMPIEVYAYSSEPMRTFHEKNNNDEKDDNEKRPIIRVSYHGKIEQKALDCARENIINSNLSETVKISRREFENVGKRDMEIALEESMKINDEQQVQQAIEFSIDTFMQQEEEKLIIEQIQKENLEEEIQNIEKQELMQAIKESQNINNNLNDNVIQDPLDNQTIKTVVQMGFQIDLVIQAYTIFGDYPDLIVNHIYENYY